MLDDPLYAEAVQFAREKGFVSISKLQQRYRIGFNKAARFVDQMEQDGLIGPARAWRQAPPGNRMNFYAMWRGRGTFWRKFPFHARPPSLQRLLFAGEEGKLSTNAGALMLILDGKATAAETRASLKEEVASLLPRAGRAPGLAVILAGDDPASQVYVRNKEKAALEVGINARTLRLAATVSQKELEDVIAGLNAEDEVDGILLQLPLPRGLDADSCIARISPEKDVDGLTPHNQGLLALGRPGLQPCTPAGVMRLLDRYHISTSGRKAVVVGRSSLVGRPAWLCCSEPGAATPP